MTLNDVLVMLGVETKTHNPEDSKWSTDRFTSHPYTVSLMGAPDEPGEVQGRLFVVCSGYVVMKIVPTHPGAHQHCDDCNRIDKVGAGYCHAPAFYISIDHVARYDGDKHPHQVLRLVQPAR